MIRYLAKQPGGGTSRLPMMRDRLGQPSVLCWPREQRWAQNLGEETLGQNAPGFRDCHPLPLAHPTTPQTCPFVFVHKTVLELIVAKQVVHLLWRQKPNDRESPGA